MKRIDVKEATEAANSIERQGRKRGLIKELNMIRLQRSNSSTHLMQMFNGVASVDNERQHLSILMELMSFSVEDVQNMCARLPPNELAKLTQTSFRNFATGNNSTKLRQEVDNLFKQQNGSCMHVMGRNKFNKPAEWEYEYDRQTALPDIVLSLLAADVLLGLQELHTVYGIVHCDVKPANVLVNFEMVKFKLTDFGCGCVMNEEDKRVRRSGVDLGSKLYKAPERLSNEYSNDAQPADNELLEMEEGDEFVGSKEVVEFTAKADVWSLGIMLLELASGEHPCKPFKSDFWNYSNLLKLSKMLKPLNFSPFLCDFVVRCLSVDETKRWTVDKLLQHPFIKKYEDVPRTKLRSFLQKLEKESATYQRKQHREALEQQILISTTRQASDNYKNQSLKKWKAFTGFLAVAPELSDTKKYPQISAHMKPTKKIN
ncbi:protein kinase [Angomonas deanei]|uniref:mitogen-activated protein kinase kinase n=1 Tax=Angomonas deanei TaxID=59799 RepID=A0A7G2C9D1_9TRYP|nr:protein kinase [Angomonas deanei]CAD2216336.1 Protein tyrosine kinase/Protein kinase domain containing protein, putative [Angomonas deanei]|eukprot:EPY41355.1 protein kinase [Angomonas deanei]